MIVQHTLTELGIHTLRVSVQYLMSPTSEPKTLRKFYRFNVLQPLVVTSNFIELDSRPMVQCQVTNATKTPIYIDEVSAESTCYREYLTSAVQINYVPLNKFSTCVPVGRAPKELSVADDNEDDPDFFDSSVRLLQPEESYAFAFRFTRHEGGGASCKTVGHPELKWCTTMGEFSVFRGEDTLLKGTATGSSAGTGVATSAGGTVVKMQCMACPSQVRVGELFEVVLRVSNSSQRPIPIRLQCLNSTSNSDVYYSAATQTSSANNNSGSSNRTSSGSNSPVNFNANSSNAAASATATLGLCVTGLTYVTLGKIEAGEFVDTTLSVFALCPGLHDLQGVYAVDSVTKQRYSSDSVCKVFVVDSEEEQLETAGACGLESAFETQVSV